MDRSLRSADGTTIAFDDLGDGPPLVLLPGALCTRGVTRPLADALVAGGLRVLNVDRRGRGGSDDATGDPWSSEREVEDVAALLDAAGGRAVLHGHSSGAGLALRCAAAGLPLDGLVLHDAPYALDPADAPASRAWNAQCLELVRAGRPEEATAAFMRGIGLPEPVAEATARQVGAVGTTLAYDSAAMGDADGGLVPDDLLAAVGVPTLVLAGGADHPFMLDVARRLADGIGDATFVHLEGHGHDAPAEVVAPPVLERFGPVGGPA